MCNGVGSEIKSLFSLPFLECSWNVGILTGNSLRGSNQEGGREGGREGEVSVGVL